MNGFIFSYTKTLTKYFLKVILLILTILGYAGLMYFLMCYDLVPA